MNQLNQHKIPLRAMFGFREPDGEDWSEVRALQLDGLAQTSDMRMAMFALLSMIAGLALAGTVASPLTAGWSLLICSLALGSTVLRRVRPVSAGFRASVGEIRMVTMRSAILALAWTLCVPVIILTDVESQRIVYALVLVEAVTLVAMLMFATSLATLPGLSVLFNVLVTVPMIAAFFWLGQPFLAFSLIAIAVSLSYFAVRSGHAQVVLRAAEQRLRDESETVSLLLREFEDSGADWLWQTDTGRKLVHVSPRFAHAIGRDPDELEGRSIVQLVAGDKWDSGDCPDELHQFADRLKRREAFSNLVLPIVHDGKLRWWELSASPRYSENHEFLGFRGVGSDITERWESQEKISHLARFDTLTGLPNRLQITEALSDALAGADKWNAHCAFLMLDLDRFKQVNDTLGHQIGDRLLAKVARRLSGLMGDKELCGRLGGDEFAIVIPEATDDQYIADLARSIIDRVSQSYEVDQHTIYIGASIGSAVGPRDGGSVEMLMRSADLALYRSKEGGRGIHNVYQPELHAEAEERRLMEIELRKALANDEFRLVYQPVVDAADGMLISFEALLRWTNGRYGDVTPDRFIPLAEDANLIVPIGEWVLNKACRDAASWPAHVRVAVNVSADQLTNSRFVTAVVNALRRTALPPQRLEIEVTESLFMRDGGSTAQVLDQLRALGIKLSLDDFGTGYSSLGYLRKTRFDTIKIDKSFVQGAARKVPESIAIIRAVVAMADSLDISTTAEGVETEEELALVRELGCKRIQGYLFGRPMALLQTLPMFEQDHHAPEPEPYRRVAFGD